MAKRIVGDPNFFTVFNGEVLFSGEDTAGKYGLWVTNGTAAGTFELTGISGAYTGGLFAGLVNPDLTVFNGEVASTRPAMEASGDAIGSLAAHCGDHVEASGADARKLTEQPTHGKVVVITGATSGIGRIAAEALAAQGARRAHATCRSE